MKINIKAVRAVNVFAAREHSRYAINGVHLTDDGLAGTAVATDGRLLAVARMESDGASDEAIVGDDFIRTLPTKKSIETVRAVVNLGVSIRHNHSEMIAPVVNGIFPRWRLVVPETPSEMEFSLTAEALEKLAKAAKLADCGRVFFGVGPEVGKSNKGRVIKFTLCHESRHDEPENVEVSGVVMAQPCSGVDNAVRNHQAEAYGPMMPSHLRAAGE